MSQSRDPVAERRPGVIYDILDCCVQFQVRGPKVDGAVQRKNDGTRKEREGFKATRKAMQSQLARHAQ